MSEEPPELQQVPNYTRHPRPSRAVWAILGGLAPIVGSYGACTLGFEPPAGRAGGASVGWLLLAGLVSCPGGGVMLVAGIILWAKNRWG